MMYYRLFTMFLVIINIVGYQAQDDDCSTFPQPKAELTTDQTWIDETINEHNLHRRRHGADDLIFNEELAKVSQFWANHLASIKNPYKYSQYKGLGENIFETMYCPKYRKLYADHPVDFWYLEPVYYFTTGVGGPNSFTQLVWKETRHIGIAYACFKNVGPYGTFVVVANYCPSGNVNFETKFKTNLQNSPDDDVDYFPGNLSIRGTCYVYPQQNPQPRPQSQSSNRGGTDNFSSDSNDTSGNSTNSTASRAVIPFITSNHCGLHLLLLFGSILSIIMITF